MIIGTAGHIDHGKTTLVKALTGTDCDRWREEKERGITLDLGYAFRHISGHGTDEAILGFIDVPGHEKLVHNMLAGATGIDFALLVITADDGPMPQTQEHLEIIELLGIHQGAVALTKIDLVDAGQLARVRERIHALLADTALASAPIFPVDARSGTGIDSLREHLETIATTTRRSPAKGRFRLAIDRVFTLDGTGTVVTGTAFSGHVATGNQLVISPTGQSVRVRSLRVQGEPGQSGRDGQRIALALTGVEKNDIERGMWLLDPALHLPQRCFAVQLHVLPSQAPLRHWTQAHCHLGADDVPARIALLSGETLSPGETGFAEILLERETSVLAGDRIILRDAAARSTIAGGKVLDIFPPTRKKRTAERLAMLAAFAEANTSEALSAAMAYQPDGIDINRFILCHNLNDEETRQLCQSENLNVIAGSAFSRARWQEIKQKILEALTAEHQQHPDMPGVERDRLRRITSTALPRPAFDVMVAELMTGNEIAQTGAWLHLPEHRLQLSPRDRQLWEQLMPLLITEPFNPPRVRDMAHQTGIKEDNVRSIMKHVARIGEVYPVAHDHYFTSDSVARLARCLADIQAAEGPVRAARLRDEIGGGRKVAIQILEFFDRTGYTRRVRDTHVLRNPTAPNPFSRTVIT